MNAWFYLMIFLPMLAWMVIRPVIPHRHQHLTVGIAVALLALLPVFLPSLFGPQASQLFFWPMAGGLALGEAMVRGWIKFKIFHHQFTTPKKPEKKRTEKNSKSSVDSGSKRK